MGAAEQQHGGAALCQLFQALQIHPVALLRAPQIIAQDPPAGGLDDGVKGIVDRGLHNDARLRRRHHFDGRGHGRYDAAHGYDPAAVHLPAVTPQAPALHGGKVFLVEIGIADNAPVYEVLQGVKDGLIGPVVGVGNGEGPEPAAAVIRLLKIPLDAGCPPPLCRGVEAVHTAPPVRHRFLFIISFFVIRCNRSSPNTGAESPER